MTIDALKFPVICFWRQFLRIRGNKSDLITTTKAGLKHGMFTDLFIVDSEYNGYSVKSAKKLHGVGFFRGYNIFLNQKIKVELNFDENSRKVPLKEVKERVYKSLKEWHGWQSGGDFVELKKQISISKSISEIMILLSEDLRANETQS